MKSNQEAKIAKLLRNVVTGSVSKKNIFEKSSNILLKQDSFLFHLYGPIAL